MSSKPLSASLLKRLGEAADGYRDGREVWCVAATKFPHDLEVFFSESEANKYHSDHTRTHSVFGPFKTGSEVSASSEVGEVVEITVTIKVAGKKKDVKIDPKKIDCLFWSESAIDKFVFPYYAQLFGVEHAAKMRKQSFGQGGPILAGHTDGTRWLPSPEI